MQGEKWECKGGNLYFEKRGESVAILSWEGHASKLEVPSQIEECPVTIIAPRAFKGNKTLHKITLPNTLRELGDWAFAYCSSLEQVTIPKKNLLLGRAIFMECKQLKRVEIIPLENQSSDTIELLAAALTFFQAYYLLDPEHTGTPEWIANWDMKLLALLRANDREELSRVELCGEEEYSIYDIENAIRERRKSRVRLLFLRLLNPIGLATEVKEELIDYLLSHTKGCTTEETWEVILEEFGEERRYYQLFASLGCLTEDNFDGILKDIGEEHSEMKAFFIRYKEEKIGYRDFFSNLSLDL